MNILIRCIVLCLVTLATVRIHAAVGIDSLFESVGNAGLTYSSNVATESDIEFVDVLSSSVNYKQTKEWRNSVGYTIAGSICVAVGVPLLLAGAVLTHTNNRTALLEGGNFSPLVPLVGGALISAVSVPLFILAHKSRSKAKAKVALTAIVDCSPCGGNSAAPGLSFVINW